MAQHGGVSRIPGVLRYIGGYNATTNTPDLTVAPSGIKKGDTYAVTVDGTFFAAAVEAGDMLIAAQDNPTLLGHWAIVQSNIGGAIVDADFTGADGLMRKTAAGTYSVVKVNLAAAVAPAVGDDNTAGYAVGSIWIDTTADKAYVCVDASTGAAVWTEVSALTGAIVDGDFTGADGLMRKTAAGTYSVVKVNLAAAVAPAVGDDNTAGYAVGSIWIDTTADKAYVCVDASTGAAVWTETTVAATSVDPIAQKKSKLDATAAPGVTDDGVAGYAVGSVWIDVTADKAYVCLDASTGAAVWTEVSALTGAIVDGDFTGSDGLMRKTGAGTYSVVKVNLAAAVAPAVGDDNTAGYAVGSIWIDTTADKAYVCVDASTGAAVWLETGVVSVDPIGQKKSKLDATAAPTVDDDTGDGYAVGSVWIDVTNDKVYQCVDATEGAAVWSELSSDDRAKMTTANGTIYCNYSTGSDVTGDGSSGTPYKTTQKGIDHIKTNHPLVLHEITIALGANETLAASLDFSGLVVVGKVIIEARNASGPLWKTGTGTTADAGAGTLAKASEWVVDAWNGALIFLVQTSATVGDDGTGAYGTIADGTTDLLTLDGSKWLNETAPAGADNVYIICGVKITCDAYAVWASPSVSNVYFRGLYITGSGVPVTPQVYASAWFQYCFVHSSALQAIQTSSQGRTTCEYSYFFTEGGYPAADIRVGSLLADDCNVFWCSAALYSYGIKAQMLGYVRAGATGWVTVRGHVNGVYAASNAVLQSYSTNRTNVDAAGADDGDGILIE